MHGLHQEVFPVILPDVFHKEGFTFEQVGFPSPLHSTLFPRSCVKYGMWVFDRSACLLIFSTECIGPSIVFTIECRVVHKI